MIEEKLDLSPLLSSLSDQSLDYLQFKVENNEGAPMIQISDAVVLNAIEQEKWSRAE